MSLGPQPRFTATTPVSQQITEDSFGTQVPPPQPGRYTTMSSFADATSQDHSFLPDLSFGPVSDPSYELPVAFGPGQIDMTRSLNYSQASRPVQTPSQGPIQTEYDVTTLRPGTIPLQPTSSAFMTMPPFQPAQQSIMMTIPPSSPPGTFPQEPIRSDVRQLSLDRVVVGGDGGGGGYPIVDAFTQSPTLPRNAFQEDYMHSTALAEPQTPPYTAFPGQIAQLGQTQQGFHSTSSAFRPPMTLPSTSPNTFASGFGQPTTLPRTTLPGQHDPFFPASTPPTAGNAYSMHVDSQSQRLNQEGVGPPIRGLNDYPPQQQVAQHGNWSNPPQQYGQPPQQYGAPPQQNPYQDERPGLCSKLMKLPMSCCQCCGRGVAAFVKYFSGGSTKAGKAPYDGGHAVEKIDYFELDLAAYIVGFFIMMMIVLIPIWDGISLLKDPVWVYMTGDVLPIVLIGCSASIPIFSLLTVFLLNKCSRMRSGAQAEQTMYGASLLFVLLLGATLVTISEPMTKQALMSQQEFLNECEVGLRTRPLYQEYQTLQKLRISPACASRKSVEECSGFQATPESDWLQKFETSLQCSGYCFYPKASSEGQVKQAFMLQEAVKWTRSNTGIPAGSVGKVVGFTETGKMRVEFEQMKVGQSIGTWDFEPSELTKAANATDVKQDINASPTESPGLYPKALFTHVQLQGSCSAMAARSMESFVSDMSNQLLYEGFFLIGAAVLQGFLMMWSATSRKAPVKQRGYGGTGHPQASANFSPSFGDVRRRAPSAVF